MLCNTQLRGLLGLFDELGHSALICPFFPQLWHTIDAAEAEGLPDPDMLVTLLRFTSFFLLESANFAAAFDSAFL
jgi:hypothetical protein